jgi:hypothetical protein
MGMIFHSNILYRSERFGGNQNLLGQLFYLALLSGTALIFFDFDAWSKRMVKKRK